MSIPPVSVIVPLYNSEEDLPTLLACLVAQTYPPERVEYLLVDNNSSDRTSTILAEAAQDFAQKGLTLRPLTENKIQSSYSARNQGIHQAQGEILVFTDGDCRPEPDWLAKMVQPFANPQIGLVVGEILALPGDTLLEKYADRRDLLSQKYTLNHPFCPYGQTANLAIRQAVFQEIGLFRPYLTTGGDADICWRILRETSWQYEFVPGAIIRHRHRSTLKALKSQLRRYGHSNRYLHELHGTPLNKEFKLPDLIYALGRWFAKELPFGILKILQQKGDQIDLIITPLDSFCFWARTQGQREAKLPELAKEIEPFTKTN